ncbi:hypothetical protein CDAR_491881 [Caerostris darwini]|uniref:Uncharacterized protein n=1 Tax=Caerostris darwini TaxID=1538125 RepID=A0AAV4N1E4_9ARAC|nr:hypothetical protein CDAR_491881 [Caerostris darwini]
MTSRMDAWGAMVASNERGFMGRLHVNPTNSDLGYHQNPFLYPYPANHRVTPRISSSRTKRILQIHGQTPEAMSHAHHNPSGKPYYSRTTVEMKTNRFLPQLREARHAGTSMCVERRNELCEKIIGVEMATEDEDVPMMDGDRFEQMLINSPPLPL